MSKSSTARKINRNQDFFDHQVFRKYFSEQQYSYNQNVFVTFSTEVHAKPFNTCGLITAMHQNVQTILVSPQL